MPSQSSGMTVTRSPTDQPSTPSPTSAMVPLISWPNTKGIVTRASIDPCRMCRSVPQRPVNATAICTSPVAGGDDRLLAYFDAAPADVCRSPHGSSQG